MVKRYLPGPKPEEIKIWRSKEFNIDNGSTTTDDDVWAPPGEIKVVGVRAVYTEASDSSMEAANFKVGTAVGGAQIVAATDLEEAKSVGTYTDATIVEGAGVVLADGILAVRHTGIATTQVGKYRVQIEYL